MDRGEIRRKKQPICYPPPPIDIDQGESQSTPIQFTQTNCQQGEIII
jgi:hypothetical protein